MEKPGDIINSSLTPDQGVAKKKKQPGCWHFLLDVLETLVLAFVLYWAINAVTARIRVDGFSMQPTLHDGERIIVNKLAYIFGEVNRGDVIVFHFPDDQDQEYIKRVIGLPGDHLVITGGKVIINGEELKESYIASAPHYQSEWTVPDNAVFVLGDNRNNSSDSHNWGPVPLTNVVGKALVIYWPPAMWGIVEHFPTAQAAP